MLTVALVGGVGLLTILALIFNATQNTPARGTEKTQTAASGTVKEPSPETPEQKAQKVASLKKNAVSADALAFVYKENEVKADSDFKGHRLVLKGKIGKIAKDFFDTPYVTLDELEFGFGSVQCMFKKTDEPILATLIPGQTIYVSGR